MGNHTRGDWEIATIDGGVADDEIVTTVDGCIVNIAAVFGEREYSEARGSGKPEPNYIVSKDEAKANARMLAAAPRLLAALRPVAERGEISAEIINNARIAVAEATGASNGN